MAKKEIKQKCFVIMPFSKTSEEHTKEYWTNHYHKFLKPLIDSSHPLKAERSSPLRGDIIRQIITKLVTVPIVVADLTDANPNVYWELGVRQSFKHSTVTIAEDGTKLLMGEERKFQPGTIYVETPIESEVRLLRNGLVKRKWYGKKASYHIDQPGVYRVEVYCRVPIFGWRPWIFSNPIYLR